MTYSHKITFSVQGTYKSFLTETYQLLKIIYINKKDYLPATLKLLTSNLRCIRSTFNE